MKLPQRLLFLGLAVSTLIACSSSQPGYSKISEVDLVSTSYKETPSGDMQKIIKAKKESDKINKAAKDIEKLTKTSWWASEPDYSTIPEVELFLKADKEIKSGAIKSAATLLEQMDKIYPFGPYSQQVQLDLIYSYYKTSDYSMAIASIDRFLRLNPTHPNVDWVIYMRGLSNMMLEDNPIQSWFGIDRSSRSQDYVISAFKDFSHLVRSFPGSPYAKDAINRLIYLKNRLAKHQYYIAKYYSEREAYVAVINRVEHMLSVFPDTLATQQALRLMQRAYKKLGLDAEANNVAELIKANKDTKPYNDLTPEQLQEITDKFTFDPINFSD